MIAEKQLPGVFGWGSLGKDQRPPLAFSVTSARGILGIGQSHVNQIVRHWFFSPTGKPWRSGAQIGSTASSGQT